MCARAHARACVYVRVVYLGVMHARQQATPRNMYKDMCMYMCIYISMHMCMFMRMWMHMRFGKTGRPCLARIRCAHAARVAVADIRAAGRLPCVCVCACAGSYTRLGVARARVRERAY